MQIQNTVTKDIYFITTTIINWVDVFTRAQYKHIIVESLEYCQKEKGLVIYAWVLMSNHLHLIAGTQDTNINISDILRDFKKFTSKAIINDIQNNEQESRREWMLNLFAYAGKNDNKIKNYKFWQEGNDIQEIYSVDYLKQKLNYIHNNPVKAEFVISPEEYKYSSAIDYAGGKGLIKIDVINDL
jgi:putative transposase